MDHTSSERSRSAAMFGKRIVVVGQCASGKSSLVGALRERGYDAYVSAQEHSEISSLWSHLHPDIVIALTVSAAEVRRRRSPSWLEWLHQAQTRRLQAAFLAADLLVDTDRFGKDVVLREVLHFLEST